MGCTVREYLIIYFRMALLYYEHAQYIDLSLGEIKNNVDFLNQIMIIQFGKYLRWHLGISSWQLSPNFSECWPQIS